MCALEFNLRAWPLTSLAPQSVALNLHPDALNIVVVDLNRDRDVVATCLSTPLRESL